MLHSVLQYHHSQKEVSFVYLLFNDTLNTELHGILIEWLLEQSVARELKHETHVLGEDLPNCYFVHIKSHMTSHGIEAGSS
jgi:hypothetical protein